MEKPEFTPKLTGKDFRRVLYKGRAFILSCALLGGAVGFFYGIGRPLQWLSEASFREEGVAQEQNAEKGLIQMLSGSLSNDQGRVTTFLTSRAFLEKLVKKEDLQATLRTSFSIKQKLINIYHNVKAVYGYIKKRPYFKEKGTLPYIAHDINFTRFEPEMAMIRVRNGGDFSVCYKKKRFAYQPIGTRFSHEMFSFTLSPKSVDKLPAGDYVIEFQPLHKVVKAYSKQIEVFPNLLDNQLVELAVVHNDRNKAQSILDSMMILYKQEMKSHQETIAKEQVEYLHVRLQEEEGSLINALQLYADQMDQGVDSLGFASTDKAYAFLAAEQSEGKKKLAILDMESARLYRLKNQESGFFDHFTAKGDVQLVNSLLSKIQELKQKREALALSIKEDAPSTAKLPLFDGKEISGITLEVAEEMLTNTLKELAEVEQRLHELSFALETIDTASQELSSLTSVLTDPLSRKILNHYNDTLFALKDEANRSQKEQARLQEELKWQRTLLNSHVKQMQHFFLSRKGQVQQKLLDTKKVSVHLTEKQLSLNEKTLRDYLNTKISHIAEERRILFAQLEKMRQEMKILPQRWMAETLVQQKLEAGKRFQEKLTQLVESKNIATNLEVIRSRPVDAASYPTNPLFPRFILFTALGSFSFALFSSFLLLGRNSWKGPALSEENLTASGFSVLGTFSERPILEDVQKMRDHDLNIIRKTASTAISENSQRALFLSGDPDFVHAVADVLKKMGKKTLVVHLFSNPSLFPQHSDEIHVGTQGRFNVEEAHSPAFLENLEKISQEYEHVLLFSSTPSSGYEAQLLATLSKLLFIRIQGENIEAMNRYYKMRLENKKLFFVVG